MPDENSLPWHDSARANPHRRRYASSRRPLAVVLRGTDCREVQAVHLSCGRCSQRRFARTGGGIRHASCVSTGMQRSAAFLLVLAAACDPWTSNGGDEVPPWTPPAPDKRANPAVAPARPAARPDPGALGGFVDCLTRCDDPGLTRVDRAECRYRCESLDRPSEGADAPAVDIDPVETVVRCMTRCPIRGGRGAACLDACEHLAADSPALPAAAVLEELGSCITECRMDRHLKPTDRSTCELNCAEVARSAGPDQGRKP